MSDEQKKVSFSGGYAQPNQESNLTLAEGVYSLSSRSNLPYVEFLGAGGFQKTISWGEQVVVPCGQLVKVKNASYHAGNVVINAGIEEMPVPARITVPVPIDSEGSEFGTAATRFLFDVRRAKRAYLYMGGIGALTVTVVGRTTSTHDTANGIISPNQGSGYQQDHLVGPAVQIPPIPLGFLAPMGDDTRPMALLDSVLVTFDVAFLPSPTAYFVAEYL